MVAKTFTLTNYNPSSVTINEINFESVAGIPHVANLSNFGGYLSGATAFTDASTYPSVTTSYVSDTSPVTALYVSHTGTTLVVSDTTGIDVNYSVSGNGYTSGQVVDAVISATWLTITGAPDFPPTIGQGITFSTSNVFLVVSDTTGISPGNIALGNGYTLGQTVVSVDSGSQLTMSDYPNGTPSPGGPITFSSTDPIGTIGAGSSISFTLDYTTSLLEESTNTARVNIVTDSGTEIVRTAIVLSLTPQPDPGIFFDPDNPLISVPPETSTPGSGTTDGTVNTGGGGGGGICFTADTMVELENGSLVRIDQVAVGDRVYNFNRTSVNTVTFIEQASALNYEFLYSPSKEPPFATINHPLYINGKLSSPDPKITKECYPWLEDAVEIKNINVEPATDKPVYNLWVNGDGTYIVNGFGTTSIIGDGGLLRVCAEQGLITGERITELLIQYTKAGSSTVLGAYIVNKYFGKLNIKILNRALAAIFETKVSYLWLQKLITLLFKTVGAIAK